MDPFAGQSLETATIADLVACLDPLFRGLRISAPIVPAGTKVYRARRVSTRPGNVAEVGPPPAILVLTPGRLNDRGESVGYFSASRRSAYFEIDPAPGEYVVLSRWRCLEDLHLLHVGYELGALAALSSTRELRGVDWVDATQAMGNENAAIYQYLSGELTRRIPQGEENQYKRTIAIGRKFLGPGPHHGLVYPSIAMVGNSDNVALKPSALSRLELTSIEFNVVKSSGALTLDLDKVDSSVSWDEIGDIKWNGRRLKWDVPPQSVAKAIVEDGKWVVYDDSDSEILPS